jgi:hypothetical protein
MDIREFKLYTIIIENNRRCGGGHMFNYFDAPLFIVDHDIAKVDIQETPFFYNDQGKPAYLKTLPEFAIPLQPAIPDPQIAIGKEYVVAKVIETVRKEYGKQTQLDFVGEQIEYDAFWVTRDIAAAFGMTLVEPCQAVKILIPETSTLYQIQYEYGVYAGHWSPYQGKEGNHELLTMVCTDLECHDFPHIFASTDADMPLVISVARYWPKQHKIRLADLWLAQGNALYVPSSTVYAGLDCIDLHNNRNSARACWDQLCKNSILTHTLLEPDSKTFDWYWNKKPTIHYRPHL